MASLPPCVSLLSISPGWMEVLSLSLPTCPFVSLHSRAEHLAAESGEAEATTDGAETRRRRHLSLKHDSPVVAFGTDIAAAVEFPFTVGGPPLPRGIRGHRQERLGWKHTASLFFSFWYPIIIWLYSSAAPQPAFSDPFRVLRRCVGVT